MAEGDSIQKSLHTIDWLFDTGDWSLMGSSLSIDNNTQDTYFIKIGPDEEAMFYSSFLLIPAGLLSGGTAVAAVSVARIAAGAALGIFVTLNAIGIAYNLSITDQLKERGYKVVKPGDKQVYGKMTLSLWQQCHCIRIKRNTTGPNTGDLVAEEIYLRPLFSGATHNSTKEYSMQNLIQNKKHVRIRRIPTHTPECNQTATRVITRLRERNCVDNNRVIHRVVDNTFYNLGIEPSKHLNLVNALNTCYRRQQTESGHIDHPNIHSIIFHCLI